MTRKPTNLVGSKLPYIATTSLAKSVLKNPAGCKDVKAVFRARPSMLVTKTMRVLFQALSSSHDHFFSHTWIKVMVAILVIVNVASMASAQEQGGCKIECFPLYPSTQPGCSFSFLCRYNLPLPPDVLLNGNLLTNFKPTARNKNATFHPCADKHCVILSVGTIGNLLLINLSLPLLQCQSDLLLQIDYRGPSTSKCRVTNYEKVNTMGCDLCKVGNDSEPSSNSSDVAGTINESGSASPLLVICIILTLLLVAVTTIAIAAIILALYFAREGLKMHWLACKGYCHREKQPMLLNNQQALLLDENELQEEDDPKGCLGEEDEKPLCMGDADV